jgi:peptidoglycan/LPS O-acetylase OafA/YrhL
MIQKVARTGSTVVVGLGSLLALLILSVLSFLYFERPLRIWLKGAVASYWRSS